MPTLLAVGVVIRDSSRAPLAESLLKLKRKHFGASVDDDWGQTEIKGKYLSQAAQNLQIGRAGAASSGLGGH